jgi:hypothetical protein
MNIHNRLAAICTSVLIVSCASIPGSDSITPWQYPDRGYSVSSSAEQAQLLAAMKPCSEHARDTFPDVLRRYQDGLLNGAKLIATVFDDSKITSQFTVVTAADDLVQGRMSGRHVINGKLYAAGDSISVNPADIVDWYVIHQDRPPEGNFIGLYLLLKQDGLAPGDCDPADTEFRRYRYFALSYSFVPPASEGWELRRQWQGTEMSMQQKDRNLDEINTLSSSLYRVSPNISQQELIESARNFGRYGDEEGDRYNVVSLEAELYPHRQARCARSSHVVEDRQALLSESGKRGEMIRDVQTLVCLHPADNEVALVLIYSHRHHRGKRDPDFVSKSSQVFASLAFRKQD